ncbi:unnamed protein product [Caenorhabditis nigoni]
MSHSPLILEELKKGVSDYSDELKDAFESRDISKFDELEDNLKKAKEVLVLRMDEWKENLRNMILLSVSLMIYSIALTFGSPKVTGFWAKIYIMDAVIITTALGTKIVEVIIYRKTDWKRRKNTTEKVSVEDGDERNETELDDLNNRYQALLKDLNENYEPMRNRYMRLRNQNAIYTFVTYFCFLTMMSIPSAINNLYYNTERSLPKYFLGVVHLFMDIIIPIHLYFQFLNFKKSKL